MPTDAWSPAQYDKFKDERRQPFFDLVAMLEARPGLSVIDLGCGTGELTAELLERFPGANVLGVDSSEAMLERARPLASPRLRFERAAIEDLGDLSSYDVVFSNAALQWVPDNEAVLGRILPALKRGAQIAVQVPTNDRHPSHALAAEVAKEPRFAKALGGFVRQSHVLTLERYAELLHAHGYEATCLEKIYGHELPSTEAVVEWVKGTLLTAYLSRLPAPDAADFLGEYRRRLLAALGDRRPYFYPFRRLLFCGRRR